MLFIIMSILKYLIIMIINLRRMSHASPVIASEAFLNSAAYISSPSIYSYTIQNENLTQQQPLDESEQQERLSAINYRNESSHKSIFNNFNRKFPTSSSSLFSFGTTAGTQSIPISDCTLDRLAVYKVILHTYWTRELFPKHYPDWRPAAQWTKTIGRTHDTFYALYHIGQQASPGVREFVETGKSDLLDNIYEEPVQQMQSPSQSPSETLTQIHQRQHQQQQHQLPQKYKRQQQSNNQSRAKGDLKSTSKSFTSTAAGIAATPIREHSIFDEFNLPPIPAGAGRSETKFFVDSNHSLVSLMTRIVPSPDWFIGVDSLQLCVGGSWIDTVTLEMDPLDAGTDNGFTFTAPNWQTSPQGVIYRIGAHYPAHPAGSFYYPKSKRLPPIASFQFIKLKEYELGEVFNFVGDDRKYETVQTQTHLEIEQNHIEMNNELSASIERERQNEIQPQPTNFTERDRIRSQLLAKMNPMNNNSGQMESSLMETIVNSYRHAGDSSKQQRSNGRFAQYQYRRSRKHSTRDCRVSHWSEWSECRSSKKGCGIGEMHRYRHVIKHSKRDGRPCPPLKQSKWCVSSSDHLCHTSNNYINWSNS